MKTLTKKDLMYYIADLPDDATVTIGSGISTKDYKSANVVQYNELGNEIVIESWEDSEDWEDSDDWVNDDYFFTGTV